MQFVFGTGFTLTGFTTLSLIFTRPDTTIFTVSNPLVSAPNTPIVTTAGLFPAGTYASYNFVQGDISLVGTYSVRVLYIDNTPLHLTSNIVTFVVQP